jgi:uncharacterized protein YbjQ (UPF0145 family)
MPGKGSEQRDKVGTAGGTSDLSIDETLLLHSVGWEAVELVNGVSVMSVPWGVWNWGTGEIASASHAYNEAFRHAASRLADQCGRAGGHGAVGVHVEAEVRPHHVDVELVGTAVRPVGGGRPTAAFISDLSAKDFTLLRSAGWAPVSLAVGAAFVYAPRRSAGTALRQASQNVELPNFTQAMYAARESAMERMQSAAISMGATGIVGVRVSEGPMSFARHAIGFTAWGTAVKLVASEHRTIEPDVVLPLDDIVVQFAAESLRGD